ncbi:MAG TPA: precorrin-6y C5,15-methyltransferase (decarboxylating) subunit CbiE, partial [Solirubrobacteraceae bacterium]|nr:precorrin-6y C5,15-methyltransferase (decarboxylating) subunit CbiE [Solirubrobacteraceae bacterium]
MSDDVITVVGIGADGWPGLGEAARAAILGADEVIGSRRQLELLPRDAPPGRPWPSPLDPLLDELAERRNGRVCVLASGDPMLHGIGATLARRLGPERVEVIAAPSAFSLACARLGWPAAEVVLVSTVARAPEEVARVLQPSRRVIAYATGEDGAAALAEVLCERGYGPSRFVVLERLGSATERAVESTAEQWGARRADPLHLVAIECAAAPGIPLYPLVPGLPDDAFESDGALTKRHVRAATLAALGPAPGALLWDVGAGSGSVAIEWLRAEVSARAIAVERRTDRAERIHRNAVALGVRALEVVLGDAPEALRRLAPPDAVFIGGGVTAPGLVERCWEALRPGGRIVANAVTLE